MPVGSIEEIIRNPRVIVRRELVPLIVPLTLIRHYVRQFEISYLSG